MEKDQEAQDEKFMHRCLQLAVNGRQNAKPNPMVGAVIVNAAGRIIGEGYHVRCGEGHAEVNAFASVRPEDERFLPESTIYVSLEPCSHYGRTPPCCDLIIRKGVRRVVCGSIDPFAKVRGRGVKKIRAAGIEVTVGVLEKECRHLNRRFMTFNTLHRPYIILKWAQSANGRMDDHFRPVQLSSDFTRMLVHQLRAENDTILVGRITDEREHPQLNVREWSGPDPERIVLRHPDTPKTVLDQLYEEQKQSLVVEGGAVTLNSFLSAGLWDEIRVETALDCVIDEGTRAPQLPGDLMLLSQKIYDHQLICTYERREEYGNE
ncbi:MAG: bifunctional diaminohydroxyphosphoribosylaminopyrimidine deaminase/5-amino-6-(5-phosphoribosylamino)uracil reductase RibD [Prevotella sp.]|jgi:diaminohydroxyphosphoribosylaminopyrimidine deaminase/5-amino-6-(5-phosphoribosylamino)uracil reductase|nr:bifunctional diaminohydroxyphosphoribosylaminopyrimidine deaminase/5-amino-6-(5-phosphoribosylamino)uracil reductase RibD [Prevotella sp.]MCH3992810.1 bifunctional diaminohydroxyphosphoribosylaminopyrimidine deaminase/5-amino-6-(5-phosphoribosylamino)uracil reductase RibD [Prevotella sp.]MCI1291758.1 bifunctional diaminohydroxyphosphoribosylaminopyrimidine deaminase/5-amino-6-(5-phosphoribosylamino)uracil reductase RibD [Prevotella sp.]MCI1472812.1 bifunctional diaminohydroxyphosphoribosylami